MKIPMTTEQVIKKYQCEICKKQGQNACKKNCVEGKTCSFRCQHCGGFIWFRGKRQDAPAKFNCPLCNKEQNNKYKKKPDNKKDRFQGEIVPETWKIGEIRKGILIEAKIVHCNLSIVDKIITGYMRDSGFFSETGKLPWEWRIVKWRVKE